MLLTKKANSAEVMEKIYTDLYQAKFKLRPSALKRLEFQHDKIVLEDDNQSNLASNGEVYQRD